MWQPGHVEPAPESSNSSGSTASQTKFWDGRVWTAPGFPQPANTPDAENPNNAAATRIQRTSKQYNEHIEQFNKNNVEGEKMDVMYKKWSHDAWDQWLFRMDDRGLEKSWDWSRLKWYEWYLAARARAQKQAEEDAKTQRLLERQMYGREEGDSDVDSPFPGEKRRRYT